MKKKYLYNGEYYTEAEMTDFAKQSGVSFDSYIAALGKDVKVLDAPYEYKGNFYTQDEISAAAKKKGINDDAYLSQNGIKKKEEAYTGGAMSSAASKIGGQVGNFVGQSEKDNALSLIQSINAGITKGIEKGKQQFPNEIRATPEEEAALRDAQRRTGQADGLFTQQGAEQFNLLATDPLRAILDPEREKLQTAYNNRRLQGVRQTSDNTIARNNIDPNKTVQKKDGKLIPDVSSNPEYQVKNQEQALENVSGLVKNKFFKNGKEALEYAENQVKSGIDPTGNETIEHAITKAGEYKQKEESALNGKSIIQNAIEIQLQNDPLFKKQYETIINGTASDAEIADVARRFNIPLDKLKTQGSLPQEVVGELVHRFISDPDIKQIAEDNPEFKKDFDNFTGDKIYEVFPEYADVYIKNTLSRARELDGKNNWFANPIFDKSKYMDNLAEEVFKDRPILLKRVKDKFHNNWEHKIETTGIVDDLATGARGAMSGMWRSLKDVSGFGESYSDRIRNTLKEQYGHVETPHQNEFRKVVGEASNFMGMVLAMGATGSGLGNIGKGLGVMNPSVASKAVTLATFFDDELNHAASIYPENPTKAYLRASLSTAFFLVAGDAIPASKITGFKQNITQTLKSLETKALDKQAKMKLRDKILSVATETLQGTAKGTAEMTVMINGFKLLIDRALGLDESSINNEYSDANLLATAKSMLFGLPVPSMIHGFKGINRTRAAIYEMASNPEKYKSAILKRFGSDDHRIADIDFIADFKKYLDSMRVAENEKAKMVFNALHAKRLREQKSPDAFMKRNHEEEIRAIEQEQQDIMDGKDSDAGLTDSQKAIKTAYENGEINEMMEAQIKEALKDPAKADQFIKEIAEQATGAVAPELGNAKDGAIKFFGETLTDFAIGKSGKKGGGESVVFEYENEGEVPQKLKPLMVKDENGRITITMPKDEADALQKRIAEGLEPDMELMDGTLIKKADIKIKDVQDGRVKYKGEEGTIYQDGQTLVFKVDGKEKEYELGNVNDISDKPISELGIEQVGQKEVSVVSVADNGNVVVREQEYVNNYSDPFSAINRDSEGNVISVTLDTKDGKKRTFRGSVADDIAYQITLKEIEKNNETKSNFEQFINTDESKQTINDTRLQETAEKSSDKTTEPISPIPTEQAEALGEQVKAKMGDQVSEGTNKEALEYAIEKIAEAPIEARKQLGDELFEKVLEATPTEKLQEGLDFLIDKNSDDPNVKELDKIIFEREKKGSTPEQKSEWQKEQEAIDNDSSLSEAEKEKKKIESTAKQKSDPDLANIDPVIIAARNGDKQAQKKLEEYGLDWEQTTTYRFVGQPEVDVLLSDKKVESKRFSDAGIDVTTSPKVTSAANAEYRVTFKESFDVNNGLGKVKVKSKEEGDHNLEKGRGYTLNDVAKIERLDENGNVVEVIYDSESLLSKEQQPSVNKGSQQRGNPALSSVESTAKNINTVNGYEFTKTPTLENVIVEPIPKDSNAIIEKQMFVDENKNVLSKGVTYIGGGWYEIGRDNFGSVDLYNTVTKEGVSLNHKQGGRMGVVVQDFIKNNSRYNDNIAVRGSKYTQEEHSPKFGGSGHYKGTYFYVGLNAESKALEHGKNLTKVDLSKANLYEIGVDGITSQSLKNEAKKAGYDVRNASGYAESEYLKKQGYDGIKRGNEVVLFDPKKFEVKAVEQSLKETTKAGQGSVGVGGDVGTKQQIENFGVNKADVEPIHSVISQVFSGLKKAGLTTAKTVGDWVGIGKGEANPNSLDGIVEEIKKTLPKVEKKETAKEQPKTESEIPTWVAEFERTKNENDLVKMEELYNKIKVVQNGVLQGRIKDPIVLEKTVKELNDLKKQIEDYAENRKKENQLKVSEVTETDTKKQPINKIEDLQDVGEKIGGAKKDLAQKLSEVTTEDLATKPLSKVFPKPNFKKLVEEGSLSEDGAILLNFLYEKIPAKPRKQYRVANWVKTVDGALQTTRQVLEAESTKNLDFTDKILKAVTLSETLKRDYKLYSDTMKGLGFPKNDVNLGGYEIKKFENRSKFNKETQKLEPVKGEVYSIVSGSSIIGDFKTMDDAINGLKTILNKSEEKTKGTKFDIYQDKKTKEFFIGKKGAIDVVRVMQGFKTLGEARNFLKDKQADIQGLWDAMKAPKERRMANRPRVGADWRKGKNVDSKEFADTFGFRGVEFGNWVNNAERQSHVNEAYDALMDLSSVLGVSPKALSLNGELGFAFGARGSGKANAHYEAGKVVINLTKTRGAGSLAHEWWHAMDNYFSRNRGQKESFITQSPRDRIERDGSRNQGVRKEMIDAFKSVMDAIEGTKLSERSKVLDRTRSEAYWSTPIEMSARAFENYIIEKLGERNQQNDYLANFKETAEWINDTKGDIDALKNYPYPLAEESPIVNEKFQQFFETIKEDEGGKLYQIIGEQGANRLDNTEMVLDDLSVAKQMEQDGKTPKEIHLATSWEKGVDGKWRFEIPDVELVSKESLWDKLTAERNDIIYNRAKGKSISELKKENSPIIQKFLQLEKEFNELDKKETKLGDIIKGELLKAYPSLKDIKVVFGIDIDGDGSTKGMWSKEENTIYLLQSKNELKLNSEGYSTLVHEIQHAIQDVEGFAKGGSPNDIALKEKLSLAGVKTVAELNEKIKTLDKEYQKIYKEWEYKAFKKRYKGQTEESRKLLKDWQNIDNQIKELKNNSYNYDEAYSKYKKLAGEVEARNAQSRINLPIEERKAKMLSETEDISREQQIVLMDAINGVQSSVENGEVNAQYRIESGKNIVEAIKDFDGSPRATVALTHEIMHPTVVAIIDGAKEGNAVGQKHTKTIVEEYNKANPDKKVTVQQMIEGNDAFINGRTTPEYRAVQEFIAEAWEKYHHEGAKGFSKAFQEVLDAITEVFRQVYKSLTGTTLTPELRKMFDELLGKENVSEVVKAPEISSKAKNKFSNLREKIKQKQSLKIVSDEAENRHANSKLTEADNPVQEPNVKALESEGENAKNAAQAENVIIKIDSIISAATDVGLRKVSDISTDEKRFQGRDKLNAEKVQEIAENWKDADQDPIHVWTDPKDGKTYVLSGHHRLAAAKQAGREKVKVIDRSKDFTEEQAIRFAKEEANANRTMETAIERANTLRQKRERGDTKDDINKFLDREGKNKNFVNNLSRLNPKGKTIEALRATEKSDDKVTQKEVEKIADWIGEARDRNKNLTDAHENELFDFLMDREGSKRITTKQDFLSKVNSLAGAMDFNANEPLNIARYKHKTEGEKLYDKEAETQKGKISDLQQRINEINDRIKNPNNPQYLNPDSKDYEEIKKNADNKLSELNTELQAESKALLDLYQQKGKFARQGTEQSSLFSTEKNETELPEDYYNDLRDIIKDLKDEHKGITLDEIKEIAKNELGEYYSEPDIEAAYKMTEPQPPKSAPEPPKSAPSRPDKSVLTNIVNAENTPPEVKKKLTAHGLKYDPESHDEALQIARAVIDSLGIDAAVTEARARNFGGAVNTFIQTEALNALYKKEAQAKTAQEKYEAAEKFAEVSIALDEWARGDAGRGISALATFYQKSPLGMVLKENKSRKEEFNQWAKGKEESWDEFLERLNKTPEFSDYVSEKVQTELREERKKERSKFFKKVDDTLDKWINDLESGNVAFSSVVPPKLIAEALKGVKAAFKVGESATKIIGDAIDYISDKIGDNWDKDTFRAKIEKALNLRAEKTSVDRYADSLKKQIEELQKQIDAGSRNKNQSNKRQLTPEEQSLLDEKKRLQKELNDIDPKTTFAQRIQKQIDDIQRQIDAGKRDEKERKNKKEYSEEEKELQEKLKAKKAELEALSPLKNTESYKLAELDKFREKLKGLSEAEKDEVVSKAYKKLLDNGALDHADLREIIAKATGRGNLTEKQAARLQELNETINAAEIAKQKHLKERTEQTLKEYHKAIDMAAKAKRDLANEFDKKTDYLKVISSSIQGNTLGLLNVAVMNPLYNITTHLALRLPIGTVQSLFGLALGKAEMNTVFGKPMQAEFFGKGGRGFREAFKGLLTGMNKADYESKEIFSSQIRPNRSLRALLGKDNREAKMKLQEKLFHTFSVFPGATAETNFRLLNFGDKPMRYSASAATAAAFAKKYGIKFNTMDWKTFMEFPREIVKEMELAKGKSLKEAEQEAEYVVRSIEKEGERSTMQQDNFFSDMLEKVFSGGKHEGAKSLAKTLTISPFVKIPSNVLWLGYNLVHPQIALAQAAAHTIRSYGYRGKGEIAESKLQMREARYWMSVTMMGAALQAVMIPLIKAGIITAANDEDDSKKKRIADLTYQPQGMFNMTKFWAYLSGKNVNEVQGGFEIPLKYFGLPGALGNSLARDYKQLTPEQKENRRLLTDNLLELFDADDFKDIENGIFSSSSSLLQGLKGGDMTYYAGNMVNLFTNLIQPAAVSEFSRAAIPYRISGKFDSLGDKIKNDLSNRSALFRKLTGKYPKGKRNIWGEIIKKDDSYANRYFGFNNVTKDNFAQFIYEDAQKWDDEDFLPPTVSNSLGGKKLTAEQLDELEENIGLARKEFIRAYTNDIALIEELGKNYSDILGRDAKKAALQYLYQKGRKLGVDMFVSKHPEFENVVSEEEKQVEELLKNFKEINLISEDEINEKIKH